MMIRSGAVILAAFSAILGAAGCLGGPRETALPAVVGRGEGRNPERQRTAVPEDLEVALRGRVHLRVGAADYLAPAVVSEGDLQAALAPLIVVPGVGSHPPATAQMGAIGRGAVGTTRFIDRQLTVYFGTSLANLRGRTYRQFHYHWWYRDAAAAGPPAGGQSQGVRITVDDHSLPRIWEVRRDSSGARLIYVSETLEAAAQREWGPPLPGRRFSVERSRAEAPDVVVVRLLADAPVPLGPWIYLVPGTMDVATLLCRCTDSQVSGPLVRSDYELRAGELASDVPRPFAADGLDPDDPAGLDSCLRLPAAL